MSKKNYTILSDVEIREQWYGENANELIATKWAWIKHFRHLYVYRELFKFWKSMKGLFFIVAIGLIVANGVLSESGWSETGPTFLIMYYYFAFFIVWAILGAVDHIYQGRRRQKVIKECAKMGYPLTNLDPNIQLNRRLEKLGVRWK